MRRYQKDADHPKEDIEKIVHASLHTPNALNTPSHDILGGTIKEKLDKIAEVALAWLSEEYHQKFEAHKAEFNVTNPGTGDTHICDLPCKV